jgi:ATP-dependent protease ClpP protease subunit
VSMMSPTLVADRRQARVADRRQARNVQRFVFWIVGIVGALSFIGLCASPEPCQAANIEFIPSSNSTAPAISIIGAIEKGDSAKFNIYANKIEGNNKVLVMLNSRGGLVDEGLKIGDVIASRGFATLADNMCASMCAVVWLAGAQRAVYSGTRIGFHAAYHGSDKQESGVSNALIGSYLTKHGFSTAAIEYITKTPPASMEWLTREKAREYGIEYKILTDRAELVEAIYRRPATPFEVCLGEAGRSHGSVLTIEQLREYMAEHDCGSEPATAAAAAAASARSKMNADDVQNLSHN